MSNILSDQRFNTGLASHLQNSEAWKDYEQRRLAAAEAVKAKQEERAALNRSICEAREAKLEAEEAKKRVEHEQRAEALAAAEQARVRLMIRANFAGTAAEFESAWPKLWEQWRDDAALQRARGEQQARRGSIASRF